ncbi:MAG: hypothetical protein JWN34_3797 [Bryobacterales bacterium]|nr:hypothetical protein [Bryobacterales bacterium]
MYPLKFVFAVVTSQLAGHGAVVHGHDGQLVSMLASRAEGRLMMLIFNAGFGGVFLIFVLLYWNVWKKRAQLGLTALEVYDARGSIYSNILMVGVALSSTLVLIATGNAGLGGITYFLTG